jgi:acyl-CoA hydrolase
LKTPSDSETIIEELVLPNDTNPLGILRGGTMMHWMDIASAICAQKHADMVAVTVSVDQFSFRYPVRLGDIVKIKAKITRTFSTSMEINVKAWARSASQKKEILTNEAFFTFVALNDKARPVNVPPIKPASMEEKEHYKKALIRKKKRIIL